MLCPEIGCEPLWYRSQTSMGVGQWYLKELARNPHSNSIGCVGVRSTSLWDWLLVTIQHNQSKEFSIAASSIHNIGIFSS